MIMMKNYITVCLVIFDDLSSFVMEPLEAREAAQNRLFWRMLAKHSAKHS